MQFEIKDSERANSEYIESKLEEEIALVEKQIEVREMQIGLWQNNGDFTAHNSVSATEIQDYIEKLPGAEFCTAYHFKNASIFPDNMNSPTTSTLPKTRTSPKKTNYFEDSTTSDSNEFQLESDSE